MQDSGSMVDQAQLKEVQEGGIEVVAGSITVAASPEESARGCAHTVMIASVYDNNREAGTDRMPS